MCDIGTIINARGSVIAHLLFLEVSLMNIAQLRKNAKMKQADLAEAMGVDRSTIAKWESGISSPKSAVLPKLANVLGCNIEKLFELPVEQTAQ